jgi:hypothetical protein
VSNLQLYTAIGLPIIANAAMFALLLMHGVRSSGALEEVGRHERPQ